MATNLVVVRGQIEANGDSCFAGSGTSDRLVKTLALRCEDGSQFETLFATGKPLRLSTTGALGDEYVDIDVLDGLTAIELLMLRTSDRIRLRIDPTAGAVEGSGGTFPTGFVGGETLTLTIDGVAVSVTFDAADQTAAQVASRINAAAALAGLPTPRANETSSGQIRIEGVLMGPEGSVVVTGGTAAGTLGLAGMAAEGAADEVETAGLFLTEFPRYPQAPTRIQMSGQAQVSIVAAGRST